MAMTDYWLSKLFFDLQHDAQLVTDYRADMAAVMERYRIKPDVRRALLDDDVAALSPLVNAYLLRFYFQVRGMPQDEFMARLHAMNASGAPAAAEVSHSGGSTVAALVSWSRVRTKSAAPLTPLTWGCACSRVSGAVSQPLA